MNTTALKAQLQQLGLTSNETDIYLALMKLGPQTKAGALIKKTGHHRNIVYTALESLVQKKLIVQTTSSGVACYTNLSPEQLIVSAQEQVALAQQVAEELATVVTMPSQEIIVYQGREDVVKFELDHILPMSNKDEVVIIGVVGNIWYDVMGDNAELYDKRVRKIKLKQRWIGYSKNQVEVSLVSRTPTIQYRYLDSDAVARSNMEIGPDYVALKHFGPQPFVVLIRNEDMVRDYKNYFEELWKQAYKIPA